VEAGFRNIWTPHVVMMSEDNAKNILNNVHETVQTVGNMKSIDVMRTRHRDLIINDPQYNHHFTLLNSLPLPESRTSVMWSPFSRRTLPTIMTLPGDRSGCGLYRTRGPLDALMAAGLVEGMSCDWMLPAQEVKRLQIDTLILQRKISDIQLQFLREYQRFLPDVLKIYELDDPLHLIPEKSIHYGQFPPDIYQRQINGIQSCDRFVVFNRTVG